MYHYTYLVLRLSFDPSLSCSMLFLCLLQRITRPVFFNFFFSIQVDPCPNILNTVLFIYNNVPPHLSFSIPVFRSKSILFYNNSNPFLYLLKPTTTPILLNLCFCIQIDPVSNHFNSCLCPIQPTTIPIFFYFFFSIPVYPYSNTFTPF